MSHSVTVTRTTTTTSGTTTAIILNSGFLKSIPGLLKVFETALGATVVGLLASNNYRIYDASYAYIFVISVTFLIGTGINLISCLLSFFTSSNLPRTMFELLYHAVAFILYLAAGIAFLVYVENYYRGRDSLMAAAIIAIINSVLYLASLVFSYKSYLA